MYYTRKGQHTDYYSVLISETIKNKLECGPMPNVMVALPNIGGPPLFNAQSLADAHY